MGRCLLAAAALLITLFTPRTANACSCHDGGPVCEAFWTTPVVFVGRVVATWPDAVSPEWRHVRFHVFEALRGTSDKVIELISGNTSCSLFFSAGETWLIYAFPAPNRSELTTGTCSRSQLLTDARADMLYAHAADNLKPNRGQIIGQIVYFDQLRGNPVSGVRVSAADASGRVTSAETDANGRFEIKAGGAGRYRMSAATPRGMNLSFPDTVTIVDPRACAEWDGLAEYHGSLTGVLVDSSGAPLPNVTIATIPAAGYAQPQDDQRALTDARGRFEIGDLVAGEYLVAIADGLRRTDADVPRLVYAGGGNGRRFVVTGGTPTSIGKFALPPNDRIVQITGVVVAGGRPAAGVKVAMKGDADAYEFRWTTVTTDKLGRFSFGVIKGSRYRIMADGTRRVLVDTADVVRDLRITIE